MTRTITIVISDEHEFCIHEGRAIVDRLCWDEMLGTIATLTHPTMNKAEPRIPPYRMTNIDTLHERERDLRRRIRELEEQLGAPRPRKPIDELVTNI